MNTTNPRGFTLVEILIAIVIFAVVLTTIYASYTGSFRVIDETESQAEIYGMAGVAMERIVEDLESVYIGKDGENTDQDGNTGRSFRFVGEERVINGRRADTLRFISCSHINLSGQDQDYGTTRVGYMVRESDGGDDFVLYRNDRPTFEEDNPIGEEADGLVLCEGLVSVAFGYHGENGAFFPSWDSDLDAMKDRIPKSVSVSLEFKNVSDPEHTIKFTTSIALPMEREYL
jgi:general secretion pathway protein J